MHIAINAWFGDNPAVGSGQYLRYLLPALLDTDDKLKITLVAGKPTVGLLNESPRVQTVTRPPPLANQARNLAKVWFEQITFPRLCRQIGAEVAHVPYFGSPLWPSIPTVVTIHDLIPLVVPAYRGRLLVRLYTALVSRAARQAAFIMADSEASRRDILHHLPVAANRVQTVYLAPAPHFRPITDQTAIADMRRKYNLPDQFMLYLGGYDVRKNVPRLIQAFAKIEARLRRAYPLVLAGKLPSQDNDFFPNPLRLAEQLGIQEQVIACGWIDEADKPLLYAAADIFVYPSQYEGFGLPVLEAMACGTPVITTNATSLPELAGSAALQVEATNVTQLAQALNQLCGDAALRQELIDWGFEQVKKFSWPQTAQLSYQAYRQVAGRTV